jgi:hypothetical protein
MRSATAQQTGSHEMGLRFETGRGDALRSGTSINHGGRARCILCRQALASVRERDGTLAVELRRGQAIVVRPA